MEKNGPDLLLPGRFTDRLDDTGFSQRGSQFCAIPDLSNWKIIQWEIFRIRFIGGTYHI